MESGSHKQLIKNGWNYYGPGLDEPYSRGPIESPGFNLTAAIVIDCVEVDAFEVSSWSFLRNRYGY